MALLMPFKNLQVMTKVLQAVSLSMPMIVEMI